MQRTKERERERERERWLVHTCPSVSAHCLVSADWGFIYSCVCLPSKPHNAPLLDPSTAGLFTKVSKIILNLISQNINRTKAHTAPPAPQTQTVWNVTEKTCQSGIYWKPVSRMISAIRFPPIQFNLLYPGKGFLRLTNRVWVSWWHSSSRWKLHLSVVHW